MLFCVILETTEFSYRKTAGLKGLEPTREENAGKIENIHKMGYRCNKCDIRIVHYADMCSILIIKGILLIIDAQFFLDT